MQKEEQLFRTQAVFKSRGFLREKVEFKTILKRWGQWQIHNKNNLLYVYIISIICNI